MSALPVSPILRLESLSKSFGGIPAVVDVSLDIREHELFALLGPSGCGKTTLLRMLAGFERPDHGRILLNGADITDVPPHRRPINMMFQSFALFPHLSVASNVAFGLKQEQLVRSEVQARVDEMLALVRMQDYAARKPHQLSGGQRQRVALARALAKRPRLLLLDEPLSALDRKLREETRLELADVQRRLGLTFVVVTHDQDEAMSMAGRIGVMNQGALVQVGVPSDVYERPNSRWVANFIGDANVIEGIVTRDVGGCSVRSATGECYEMDVDPDVPTGAPITLMIRPEKVTLRRAEVSEVTSALMGTVVDVAYFGGLSHVRVRHDSGAVIRSAMGNRGDGAAIGKGDRVVVAMSPAAGVVLPS